MIKIILSESRYDYKYKSIFSKIPNVKVYEGGFFYLLKILATNKCIYHIRYIKYSNLQSSLFRILLIFFVSKLSHSKILWTCHNIKEHNISSEFANKLLRNLICRISYKIIVFHGDLISYLPSFVRTKTTVASFGDFKDFIKSNDSENIDFQLKYADWLQENNIKFPDLITISAAKRSDLEYLINNLNGSQLSSLLIAPKRELKSDILKSNSKILYYNQGFVRKEVYGLLNGSKSIGFIGHKNISVPTSIYMFASFGIPVIGLNFKPVSSIINKYGIGEVWHDGDSIEDLVKKINEERKKYVANCNKFLSENSWESSAKIHEEIF